MQVLGVSVPDLEILVCFLVAEKKLWFRSVINRTPISGWEIWLNGISLLGLNVPSLVKTLSRLIRPLFWVGRGWILIQDLLNFPVPSSSAWLNFSYGLSVTWMSGKMSFFFEVFSAQNSSDSQLRSVTPAWKQLILYSTYTLFLRRKRHRTLELWTFLWTWERKGEQEFYYWSRERVGGEFCGVCGQEALRAEVSLLFLVNTIFYLKRRIIYRKITRPWVKVEIFWK